jgi:positive regulator of sigma E activity
MRVVVENTLNLMPDQRVEVGMPSQEILKLSFVVYFIPVIVMLLVAGLAYNFMPDVGIDRSLLSFLVGVVALTLAFIPLKRFDKRARATGRYTPRVLRVIPPSGSI